MNHKDLKDSLALLIENTWKELILSQSPFPCGPPMPKDILQKKNADSLAQEVAGWNIHKKQFEINTCLHVLMEAKKELINSLSNPTIWPILYLSKPSIQQYVTWVIDVNRNKEVTLILVKQLITPLDLYIMDCEDFTGLLKMKLYNSSIKHTIQLQCCDFMNLHSVVKFMSEQLKDEAIENSTELRYHQTQYMQISIKQLIDYLCETGQHYELMFLYTLLYPFGYDKQEQLFWHLMSLDELEYLSKQLEEPTVAFFEISHEENVKLQACLFYLTFKVIGDSQISDLFPRAKDHVEYLKNELKSELVPQISDILEVSYDINSDWINKLESDMLILYKGFKPQTTQNEHSLLQILDNGRKMQAFGRKIQQSDAIPKQDIISNRIVGTNEMKQSFSNDGMVKQIQREGRMEQAVDSDALTQNLDDDDGIQMHVNDTKEVSSSDTLEENIDTDDKKYVTQQLSGMKIKADVNTEMFKFNLLLDLLQLDEKYPEKFTKNDAMMIRYSTLGNVKSTKQLELLPYVVMQKIMACDSQCRSCLFSGSINIKDQLCDYSQRSDHDASSDSSSSDSDSETCNSISPIDVILALLHCSDNFLRQDLMRKLSMCQFAIPCILPNPLQRDLKFLVWSLRTIIKTWICRTGDNVIHKECPIVEYKAPLITFLRIGKSKVSKSEILNNVISDSNHDFFFKWNCDGGNYERLIYDGVVDLCWYLPQGNDKDFYPDVITFLNLHGDVLNHSMQLDLINSVSSMLVILVGKGDKLCDAAISLLEKLESSPTLLFTSKNTSKNVAKQLNHCRINYTSLLIKSKTTAEIQKKLQIHIRDRFHPPFVVKHISLTNCAQAAVKLGFKVDEENESIELSKGLARNLMNEIMHRSSTKAKSELLLLQGPLLWHQWAKHDKERCRHVFKHKTSIEQYNSQKDAEKLVIRQQQMECSEKLSPVMENFLDSLLCTDGNVRKYFIEWMKILLDDYSRTVLPQFYKKYKEIRATLMHLKDKLSEGSGELKQLKFQLKRQNENLAYASFGFEHFFREIGQIYESRMDPLQTGISEEIKDQLWCLPRMAANLIDEGYGMEVMDGDASHVPITWISAVLDELKSLHEHKKLFTISVLGIQSSGKSTLLNTMFGLQFHASAGRCTRGVFLQLLKVDDEAKKKFNCDLIIVIDTEGLRAPELQFEGTQTHDNELATFVIGLADVTIINIYGETPGDLDDILQTAVHAFIRMKKMTFYPKCQFVHQNVNEITSNKSEMGRQKFLDSLDKITVSAATLEHSEVKYKSFKHVISFNEETDVHYFPALWKGDPPMAPVNPGYSQKAQLLRHTMIRQSIKPHDRISKDMKPKSTTFVEFKSRLKYIWEAVLHENFIFSFKNSMEIVAYNELDIALNKWSWKFQESMQSWQCEAENKIYNAKDEKDLETIEQECYSDATVKSNDICKSVMSEFNAFFEENEHALTLAQWKGRTEERIQRLNTEFDENALMLCKNFRLRKQERFKLQKLKNDQRSKVQTQINELVLKSKNEGMDLTDEQLEKKFEENWNKWKEDFGQVKFISDEEIDRTTEHALKNIFRPQYSEIMQSLNHKSLSSRNVSETFSITTKEHLTSRRWFGFSGVQNEDEIFAQDKTTEFMKVVKHPSLTEDCKNFSEGLITAPLNELNNKIRKFNKGRKNNFAFSSTYTVDIAIHVSVRITQRCKSMMEEYRKKNDPLITLEDQKSTFLNTYKSQYKEASCDKTAADNFCQLLTKPIESQIVKVFPKEIISLMKEKSTFQSKQGLKCKILQDLAHEDNFQKYKVYLDNAEESYRDWAETYIENHCNMRTTTGNTKLVEISTRLMNQTFQRIKSAVKETSENLILKEWLEQFHNKLNGTIQLEVTDLTGAIGIKRLTNYEFFCDEIDKGLNKALTGIKKSIETPASQLAKELLCKAKKSIDLLLYEPLSGISLTGCTARCPFCKEFCEFSDPNHTTEQEFHSMKIHRPQCLGKFRWIGSQKLVVELCTSLVGSDSSFICSDTNGKWVKYKEYKTIYPNWNIVHDTVQVSDYWKWFVAKHNRQLAIWANAKEADIPGEWHKIDKDKAIKSVKDTYNT